MNKGLIFIPDISGFTDFVTSTEISHSRHIISELLELIIDQNRLDLELSEIEGDAVLFFRRGDAPEVTDVLEQVRAMFVAFHTHLNIIERDTVCQCGACRSAAKLTLKFIGHFGDIDETLIAGRLKLHGAAVILAHRLLKNTVPSKEYLLLTGVQEMNAVDIGAELPVWASFSEHVESVEHFGQVRGTVADLLPLHSEVPEAAARARDASSHKKKADAAVFIEAPMSLVHSILIDPDEKFNYVPNLKESVNSQSINRIDASHTCVFDDSEVHFVTLGNRVSEKEIIYTEFGEASIGVQFVSDFRLKEKKGGTELSLFVSVPRSGVTDTGGLSGLFKQWKNAALIALSRSSTRKSLKRLKQYCEMKAGEEGVRRQGV